MSEQKSLENVINLVLKDETKENALNFTAFLRAKKLQIEYNPNEYGESKWTGAIGGVVGDSIGYMYINSGADFPDPWNIWLNEYDFNDSGSAEDGELKNFLWENVNKCSRCNTNWEKCGGGEKTVLGKKFDSLCHSPMFFYTPDAQKLEMLKKLILKVNEKRSGRTGGL